MIRSSSTLRPVMFRLVSAVACAALLAGCSSMRKDDEQQSSRRVQDAGLVGQSYSAADRLLEQVPYLKGRPLLTGTFVDVSSLEDSSPLGRIVSEQISSKFAQEGHRIIELKMRRNVFIKQRGGEFMLSREVRDLSQTHNAAAVIAGTYAVGRRNVYVSARLIRADDNLVLAAHDYVLPLGPDTRELLAGR